VTATQTDRVAQVYARSLFELAEQAGGREKILEIGDELEQICELARADRGFGEFMRSPIIERHARSTAIGRLFANRITDLTLRFLLVLNDKGRLSHLEPIAAAYDQAVQEHFGRVEVDVYTPAALEPADLERVRARVQEALRLEPVLYSYTDPSLLGGIKLRIGDRLIDASVATRLRRLRDQLQRSGGAAMQERLGRILGGAGA
jgi:F-type H+-transporting ATPase subunit delta